MAHESGDARGAKSGKELTVRLRDISVPATVPPFPPSSIYLLQPPFSTRRGGGLEKKFSSSVSGADAPSQLGRSPGATLFCLYSYGCVRRCSIAKVPAPSPRRRSDRTKETRRTAIAAHKPATAPSWVGPTAVLGPHNWKPGSGRQCAGGECYRTARLELSSVSVCRTNGNVTASGSPAGMGSTPYRPRRDFRRRACRNRDRYLFRAQIQAGGTSAHREANADAGGYPFCKQPLPVLSHRISSSAAQVGHLDQMTGRRCHPCVTTHRHDRFTPISCRDADFPMERGIASVIKTRGSHCDGIMSSARAQLSPRCLGVENLTLASLVAPRCAGKRLHRS